MREVSFMKELRSLLMATVGGLLFTAGAFVAPANAALLNISFSGEEVSGSFTLDTISRTISEFNINGQVITEFPVVLSTFLTQEQTKFVVLGTGGRLVEANLVFEGEALAEQLSESPDDYQFKNGFYLDEAGVQRISSVNITVQDTPSHSELPLENTINVELDTPFQLQYGQVASISSEELEIKFLNVTQDSRCPTKVQCIRAGEVTIELEVLKDNSAIGNLCLTSEGESEDVRDFNGYSIKLVKVDPYPTTTQPIKTSNYVATLIVSKSSSELTTSPNQTANTNCAFTSIQ